MFVERLPPRPSRYGIGDGNVGFVDGGGDEQSDEEEEEAAQSVAYRAPAPRKKVQQMCRQFNLLHSLDHRVRDMNASEQAKSMDPEKQLLADICYVVYLFRTPDTDRLREEVNRRLSRRDAPECSPDEFLEHLKKVAWRVRIINM